MLKKNPAISETIDVGRFCKFIAVAAAPVVHVVDVDPKDVGPFGGYTGGNAKDADAEANSREQQGVRQGTKRLGRRG